jgi:hypothetical protein
VLIKQRVLENQNSALLRLPREIRDCIWKHALGGNIFPVAKKYSRSETYTIMPKAARPSNGVALLRTCRQIYSETARLGGEGSAAAGGVLRFAGAGFSTGLQ